MQRRSVLWSEGRCSLPCACKLVKSNCSFFNANQINELANINSELRKSPIAFVRFSSALASVPAASTLFSRPPQWLSCRLLSKLTTVVGWMPPRSDLGLGRRHARPRRIFQVLYKLLDDFPTLASSPMAATRSFTGSKTVTTCKPKNLIHSSREYSLTAIALPVN